ncbi:McrC family protein [Fibrella forsythiae]|uniref:Restriction endonuclease n=1 Tax=Fibrella forsythiae TaxID=2817061 RepID=A0ABS3JH97_9BACT|nr:restriction endonuclease [Fibrella forsythiae]MBO0949386.1 restriction endonuclease [Fibrella forsythiae]
MQRTYTLAERGTLHRASDFPDRASTPDDVLLPDADFNAVKQLATRTDNTTADALLTYTLYRGRERMLWRNYVGLLTLTNGLSLEVRPRAGHLPTLLRHLPELAFRHLDSGQFGAQQLPLWELFINAFLRETAQALGRGLARDYVTHDDTLPILRGKMRVADQLRQPSPRPDQLAVSFDEHTPDIAANRVLKKALQLAAARTQTTTNQTRCRQLLTTLADVSEPTNLAVDLQRTRPGLAQTNSRLLKTYEPALRWANWLLRGQGPGLCTGPNVAHCLLFPMERVFEQYVAAGFRRAGVNIEIQQSSAWLIDDHNGTPRFKLRPDLLLRHNGRTVVLDTKWKTLDPNDHTGHYGIDQADLYQLYAYGKKYDAAELVLIYPAHDQFQEPLQLFGYDASLRLRVVPFNLDKPLNEEITALLGTLG